jgi:hypothetical protein
VALTIEQRVARLHNLIEAATVAINTIYATKVVESRQPSVRSLVKGLVLQAAQDGRELVQDYGTQTHSFVQLDLFERQLKDLK